MTKKPQPDQSSLRQPSPLQDVPTIASGDTTPPEYLDPDQSSRLLTDDEWVEYMAEMLRMEGVAWRHYHKVQMEALIERLDEPCPHGTKVADSSSANILECDICWQELKATQKENNTDQLP